MYVVKACLKRGHEVTVMPLLYVCVYVVCVSVTMSCECLTVSVCVCHEGVFEAWSRGDCDA